MSEGQALQETSSPEELQALKENLLHDAGEIMIEHGERSNGLANEKSVLKRIFKRELDPDSIAYFYDLDITVDTEGTPTKVHWEGESNAAYKQLRLDKPRVKRVLFHDIAVDDQRDGKGNPALNMDLKTLTVRLEDGGIRRSEEEILNTIDRQMTLTESRFAKTAPALPVTK